MRRLLLAAFLPLAAASSAAACLNDVTIKGSEREFRSQYQTTPPAAPAADDGDYNQKLLLRGAGGLVLLVAAVALTVRRAPAA